MIADVDTSAVRWLSTPVAVMEKYFRYELRELSHVPQGASLIVGNHSGGKLPADIFLFARRWYEHFLWQRPLRLLAHDTLMRLAPQSLQRLGAVNASPSNAHDIFARGEALAVFPGGEYETFRPYSERYKIDFRGRTGFVRLALKARVPILPMVTIGSHELFFILTRGERLGHMLGMKKLFRFSGFPISLGFPFGLYLGPVPSPLPLPAKITAQVLEPVHLWKREHDHPAYGEEAASDGAALAEMSRLVQTRMQRAMDALASERRFPVIG